MSYVWIYHLFLKVSLLDGELVILILSYWYNGPVCYTECYFINERKSRVFMIAENLSASRRNIQRQKDSYNNRLYAFLHAFVLLLNSIIWCIGDRAHVWNRFILNAVKYLYREKQTQKQIETVYLFYQ